MYRWRDKDGRVIYVGKAKSLRQRLNSYFADIGGLHPRTASMVTSAASVEWTVVGTEVEALQLEYNWIKEFDPRFNVRYRDDKSYPELAVTLHEEFPRFQVMRGPHRKGVRYFGPYAHAWAIRETLDLLLRVFPARTCSSGVFKRAQQIDRPCLLGYIGKCSAPCVGRVSPEQHRDIVEDFCDFLAGRAEPMVKRMEREMRAASDDLDFERAARLRDDLSALRRALEKQSVVLANGTDADLIGIVGDDLEASVQIFHVRGGRMRGQRGWIVDVDVDSATDATGSAQRGLSVQVENFLVQYYGNRATESAAEAKTVATRLTPRSARSRDEYAPDMSPVPREILVPALPPEPDQMADWLSGLRGSRVSLRIPQRGDKKDLAETAARNAKDALARHRLKRASDITSRSAALTELADALGMDNSPLRIECIDISHVQGTNVVASLVVFEDGLAKRSDYRRFAIRDAPGDDVASIAEVVRRRFARQVKDEQAREVDGPALPPGIDPETGRVRRFAYPPQLLVVDGGQPQVNAAAAAMTEWGIVDVTVVGLAKRLEEVWLPGDDEPVILPRTSEALYLLQRLRDEAHRFAITYHREKRSKAMTVSALDDIPGLGATRRTALLKHFGSVAKLRAASVAELTEVPGIGAATAASIAAALAGELVATGTAAPARPAAGPADPTGSAAIAEPTGDARRVDVVRRVLPDTTPGVRAVTDRRENERAMAGVADIHGREE